MARRHPVFAAASARDFAAGALLIVVPYGLAVVVQDVVVPALHAGDAWPLAACVLGAAALVLATLLVHRTAMASRAARSALAVRESTPRTVPDASSASRDELEQVTSRIVTLVRWLTHDLTIDADRHVMRAHLADLATHADRVAAVVRGAPAQRPRRRSKGPRVAAIGRWAGNVAASKFGC